MKSCASVVALLSIVLASSAGGDEIDLVASRDNTIFQNADSVSNGAGPALFAGISGQGLERRALVAFDVAARVPAGATIDSVALTLQVSNAPNTIARSFSLRRLLRDWGEGASSTSSGTGAPATPGDATWKYDFFPDFVWTNPGGDFDDAASASQTITGLGSYRWTGARMLADVRAWQAEPANDFGWIIVGDDAVSTTARRFESRESTTASQRPTLAVFYTPMTTSVIDPARDPIRLGPIFPNPATREARAILALSEPTAVRAWVEDIAGRRIITLSNDRLPPGRHALRWDGRGEDGRAAAPGIYRLRVLSGKTSIDTRRFALIR
jgi:hypothetical protein